MTFGTVASDQSLTNLRVTDTVVAGRTVATQLNVRNLTVLTTLNGQPIATVGNSETGSGGGLPGQQGATGVAGMTSGPNGSPALGISVNADTTLTASDSGATVSITPSGTSAFSITLPPASGNAGVNYDLTLVGANSQPVIVDAGGAPFTGCIINGPTGSATITQINGSTQPLTFIGSLQTAGDYAQITSNGTIWQLFAVSQVAGGINSI